MEKLINWIWRYRQVFLWGGVPLCIIFVAATWGVTLPGIILMGNGFILLLIGYIVRRSYLFQSIFLTLGAVLVLIGCLMPIFIRTFTMKLDTLGALILIAGLLLAASMIAAGCSIYFTVQLKKELTKEKQKQLRIGRNITRSISVCILVLFVYCVAILFMKKDSFLSLLNYTWKVGGGLVVVTIYVATWRSKKLQEVKGFKALYQELVQHFIPFALTSVGILLMLVGLILTFIGHLG